MRKWNSKRRTPHRVMPGEVMVRDVDLGVLFDGDDDQAKFSWPEVGVCLNVLYSRSSEVLAFHGSIVSVIRVVTVATRDGLERRILGCPSCGRARRALRLSADGSTLVCAEDPEVPAPLRRDPQAEVGRARRNYVISRDGRPLGVNSHFSRPRVGEDGSVATGNRPVERPERPGERLPRRRRPRAKVVVLYAGRGRDAVVSRGVLVYE